MPAFFAQIAPQRSTQYSALASALAPHELALSPAGRRLTSMTPVQLGGLSYLKCELASPLSQDDIRELGALAMTSAFFDGFDGIGDVTGPLLRPIETGFEPAFPPDLLTARRYRGKTSEAFTLFMLNIARFSSAFADQPWSSLRVFDPLMGGGTTLLAALVLGADAMGVERGKEDVESTATFIAQYAREQGIACEAKEERLKKFGRRWWFTLGPLRKQCVFARGDALQSAELMRGVKRPHLIVTDLPYGIQHRGEIASLLTEALPVWTEMLLPGGVITMSWDSTRFPREDMIAVVQSAGAWRVFNDSPYGQVAHRVDRVIKRRDVLVATKFPLPLGEGRGEGWTAC